MHYLCAPISAHKSEIYRIVELGCSEHNFRAANNPIAFHISLCSHEPQKLKQIALDDFSVQSQTFVSLVKHAPWTRMDQRSGIRPSWHESQRNAPIEIYLEPGKYQ